MRDVAKSSSSRFPKLIMGMQGNINVNLQRCAYCWFCIKL